MDTAFARRQMVRQQVRAWDVFDPDTLDLLSELRRDRFVPAEYAELAYADTQVPLPCGQLMMTPIVEGRLLQSLDPQPGERVLEVGAGSGFLTACLAARAGSVVSVELFDELFAFAKHNLDDAGVDNVELVQLDAMASLPDGSFDVIAVTGSMAEFDPRFAAALAPGGRLFVVVGEDPVMQARLLTKRGADELETEALFETSLRPLVHATRDSTFTF